MTPAVRCGSLEAGPARENPERYGPPVLRGETPMNSMTWNRRIVLASATATLIGGVALPATAMAAPTTPQHTVTQTPHDDNQDTPNSNGGTMGGDGRATGDTAKSLSHTGSGGHTRHRFKVDPDGDVYISPGDRKAAIGDDNDVNIDDDFAADPDDYLYLYLKSLGIDPDDRNVDIDDGFRTDFPDGDLD